MMRILFFVSILSLPFYSIAQSNCKKQLSAYLSDPDVNGKTNIRQAPKGAVIQQVPAKDAYEISIVDAKDGWLKINKLNAYDNESIKLNASFGWVHSSIVKCGTRNYDGSSIKIYETQSATSKIVATIHTETEVNILDICNEFAKVSWIDSKKIKLTGWIATKWLCSSAVTNCN